MFINVVISSQMFYSIILCQGIISSRHFVVKSKGFQSRVSLIGGSFDAGFTRKRGALATNPGGFIVIAMMINDR